MGRLRKNDQEANYFSVPVLDAEKAWVLGWLYSDGNNNHNGASITVHIHDEEVLHKVASLVGPRTCVKRAKGRNVAVFSVNSRTLSDRLSEIGCVPCKSLIIQYPSLISETLQHKHFLRGVFEGDGSVYRNERGLGATTEISSGSLAFLQALKDIIHKCLGVDCTIRFRGGKPVRLSIGHGCADGLRFLDFIYEDVPERITLKRKHTEWLKLRHRMANPEPHRTWRINADRHVAFYILSPKGELYHSDMVKPFADELGLGFGNLSHLIRKDYGFKSVKGWTLPSQERIDLATQNGTVIVKRYARAD